MTQPMPKPGKQSVLDAVVEDLRKREVHGVQKYGRRLESFNGRDALQDAYEEALDLAQYLKQALLERDRGIVGALHRQDCCFNPACICAALDRVGATNGAPPLDRTVAIDPKPVVIP